MKSQKGARGWEDCRICAAKGKMYGLGDTLKTRGYEKGEKKKKGMKGAPGRSDSQEVQSSSVTRTASIHTFHLAARLGGNTNHASSNRIS
jgi:hypothetical protein